MSEELEKEVTTEVSKIGCLVVIILILLMVNSCSTLNMCDLLNKHNKILQQILYYTEGSK